MGGTGLYSVKVTPTKNDDTQSGAAAGQVITVTTGGLGTSDAFKGGYVTNVTETETRAIVSHTDTTITLEGDLTNWTDTDDLDIYDAWDTIQGAHDQLVTDQSTDDYTARQELRLYAGTYSENVTINVEMRPTGKHELMIRANTGDSVTVAGGAGHCFQGVCYGRVCVEDITFTTDTGAYRGIYATTANKASGLEVRRCTFNCGRGIEGAYTAAPTIIEDCVFTTSEHYGCYSVASGMIVRRCTFTGGTQGVAARRNTSIEGCTFDGCGKGVYVVSNDNAVGSVSVVNCTFYNCTTADIYAEYTESGTQRSLGYLRALNNIHHTSAYAYWIMSGCTLDHVDRNCIYNATKVARVDETDYTTLANWQAWADDQGSSPDANSTTADPLLADPGNGDFTPGVADPVDLAGRGAGVTHDVNGNPYDPAFPTMGAVSLGVLSAPNAPGISGATASGKTVTVTVTGSSGIPYRARLVKDGVEVDEQGRTGPGDITLTAADYGTHSVAAWGSNIVGRSEPSLPSDVLVLPSGQGEWKALVSKVSARFNTQVATPLSLPTFHDNADVEDKPSDARWCRFSVRPGIDRQIALGASKRFRTPGVAIAQLFAPINKGDATLYEVADAIKTAFRAVTADGVHYQVPYTQVVGKVSGQWQINVVCPFDADATE
jgi:hypothetical protein